MYVNGRGFSTVELHLRSITYSDFSPQLTWRDIQHLTVLTSKRNSLFDAKGRFHWTMNGVGLEFNHLFGYGVLDAGAMVALAKKWKTVPPRYHCEAGSVFETQWVCSRSYRTASIVDPDFHWKVIFLTERIYPLFDSHFWITKVPIDPGSFHSLLSCVPSYTEVILFSPFPDINNHQLSAFLSRQPFPKKLYVAQTLAIRGRTHVPISILGKWRTIDPSCWK